MVFVNAMFSDAACEKFAAGDEARSGAVENDRSTAEEAHWRGLLKIREASEGGYIHAEAKAKPFTISITASNW